MPVVKEDKIPEAFKQQYLVNGPCLKVGMEVWTLTGTRLQVGKIKKVVEGKGVQIEFPRGTVFRSPTECILMTKGTKI
jgi:hypothetical protein